MPENSNIFVYAVCGDDVHIDTLNFSLQYLKHFSENKIIVVTDSKRNKKKINHDKIIDIETPEKFTNHQASIFLKTGLYKYLDMSCNYCYIDSDVIAVNKKVDKIFDNRCGIVSFAKDHCLFHEFSPYAVNCGCIEKSEQTRAEFYKIQKQCYPEFSPGTMLASQEARQLYSDLYKIKQQPFANLHIIIKYIILKIILPVRYFRLNKNYMFDKKRKLWLNKENKVVMSDILGAYKKIEKNSNFKFDRIRKYWKDSNGNNIFDLKCSHLHDEVFRKFDIEIKPANWQHWNGGVFLFDKYSVSFLETWHKLTMDIFEDAGWKTRDQATLATAAWKFGIQNQKTLPLEFNFIADFYKPEISYNKEKGFTVDNFKTTFEPAFIHVYHHFGDKNWNIWQYILACREKLHDFRE